MLAVCVEVGCDHVRLADGQRLACGLVVWSTGLAPRWFTQQLTLPKNRAGQVGHSHTGYYRVGLHVLIGHWHFSTCSVTT